MEQSNLLKSGVSPKIMGDSPDMERMTQVLQ